MPFGNRRTMSLSQAEFTSSISKLGPHRVSETGYPIFDIGPGYVKIQYASAPAKTLGGLLALPQATVTLLFDNVSANDEAEFLHRFDIAFQRGGG